MRFRQFLEDLAERPFTKDLDVTQSIDWIKTHSKTYVAGQKLFFRGMSVPGQLVAQYGDSSSFKRKSKNTDNYYTLMIESSPAWHSFPPRSSAFVCSSSQGTADRYGNDLFAVFPEDGAVMGLCPTFDLWQSFNTTLAPFEFNSLKRFNEFLNELADFRGVEFTDHDASVFREQLQWFDIENLRKIKEESNGKSPFGKWEKFGWALTQLVEDMEHHGWDHLEIAFDHILDPEMNGFSMCHAKDWSHYYERDIEVWFSGKAVFIPTNWLNKNTPFGESFLQEFGWI